MMLQNDEELRHSYETIAKMYRLRDRCAAETLWDPEARQDVVAGIENQIRKIEREITEYLTQRQAKAA
jgi:transcription termination factor NusB